jgi:hypothetical protein
MNVFNSSNNGSIDTTTGTSVASNPLAAAIGIALGKASIAIGFLSHDSNAALLVSSGRILTGMTGNPHFPTPIPALADVAAVRNAFVASVDAARAGPLTTIARRQQRVQLVAMLRSLALHVQQTGNGDPLVLRSSGFPVRKSPQPVGLLSAPLNLRLVRGTLSGQLKARCNVVNGAGSYQWRYATAAAPTAWVLVDPTIYANFVFAGLVPGTVYVAQVRAVGTAGPSDWSDTASLMVV